MSLAESVPDPLDVAFTHGLFGRFDEGEALMRSLSRRDARAQFNMGWYECRHGLWHNASVYLDVGRTLNCYGSPPLKNGKPIWNEFPLEGRTLHLRCEGGYGDEIIGVRWARHFAARGARVHVSCSPALASLFARAPGVSAVTAFQGADHVHCDWWVPAMSCPRWFEPTGESYLETDKRLWGKWGDSFSRDGKVRVGVKWAGNPKFEGEQHRRFDPQLMIGLADDERFSVYSLQVGNDMLDLPDHVVDLSPSLTNWDETAAALAHMDLVITSCTGVAHCAAALGRPTWIVVPVMPYYLWAVPGEKSVWYDSVRLFRQTQFGDWREPFEQIKSALKYVKLKYDGSSFQPYSLEQAKMMVVSTTAGRYDGETAHLIKWLSDVVTTSDVVLDYGCGVGRVAKALIDEVGCFVVGVDNEDMLRYAREYVASDKFTCTSKIADVAACIFVLQHAERPAQVVDDVWRSLKPNGLLVTLDEPRRLATLKIPQDQSTSFRDDGIVVDDVVSKKFDLVRQEDFPWRDSKIKLWRRRDAR